MTMANTALAQRRAGKHTCKNGDIVDKQGEQNCSLPSLLRQGKQ